MNWSERYECTSFTTCQKVGLSAVSELLRSGMNLKYNSRLDAYGFYANEAIDHMVKVGLTSSRTEAKNVGRSLEGTLHFIEAVESTKKSPRFDDTKVFYRFVSEDPASGWEDELESHRDFLLKNVKERDHTFRMKVYHNTFTGTEVVDLLNSKGVTTSRLDAVLLCRALSVHCNLISHVAGDHEFEDADFFYTFVNTASARSR